jgi:hypothetical protein
MEIQKRHCSTGPKLAGPSPLWSSTKIGDPGQRRGVAAPSLSRLGGSEAGGGTRARARLRHRETIWGRGETGGHRKGLSTVVHVGGGGHRLRGWGASWSRGGSCGVEHRLRGWGASWRSKMADRRRGAHRGGRYQHALTSACAGWRLECGKQRGAGVVLTEVASEPEEAGDVQPSLRHRGGGRNRAA